MNDQFYLTLPSDSSEKVFPRNTQCCYNTKLPQFIQLDHEAHWEVALVEIVHPTKVYNISQNQGEFWVTILNKTVQDHLDNNLKPENKFYKEKTSQFPK